MTEKYSLARRHFLNKITAAVSGTTALAVVSPLLHASPVIETDNQAISPPKSKGYQRTEHVDTYYHLADF